MFLLANKENKPIMLANKDTFLIYTFLNYTN